MRSVLILAVLTLAACDSPSPAMWGADVAQIEVDGSTFSVRRAGDRVEALRVSMEFRPKKYETLMKAAIAMQQTTGCAIRTGSLRGDQAVARAELDCEGAKPPVTLTEVVVQLDCEAAETWRIDGLDQDFAEVDCTLEPYGQ